MIIKCIRWNFRNIMMKLKDSMFKESPTESYMNEYLYHKLKQRTDIYLQENFRAVYGLLS